ncbi:MAG: hypothetical protein PHV03_08275 [Desulfitobacteriaceae bacterium]|nr:hypothetical protein [Desulfitobacteriaceae bacterium]MDD3833785.1 hypothetical protein [Oscillospiraceae bacterium]MDD4401881.1 hypothetical protein [Desulfitobacteriaceae bacterium]
MQGIAKAILISILVTICIMLFSNMIFFFPWYMTLVTETFNLSQVAANDNYIKQSYYDDALDRLQNRPIFRDKPYDITIKATNDSGYFAVGDDDETIYLDLTEIEKPYRQRGRPIEVKVSAVYPFSITLWGKKLERELPVNFLLTTTGLKHYKDLEYYY